MRPTLTGLILLLPLPAIAAPVLTHQARLTDTTGEPIEGPVVVELRLFDAEDSTTPFHDESQTLTAQSGYVSMTLGADDTDLIDPADMADGATWLETWVDNVQLGERTLLSTVPAAVSAITVSGGAVDATALSIDGTPFVDASGTIVRDLVVDGSFQTTGVQFPYTVRIAEEDWFDSDLVTLSGANATLRTDGGLQTGADFSGPSTYIDVQIVEPGVLPDIPLRVSTRWRRLCRTTDCDTITRLVDGSNQGWVVTTYDNDGGGTQIRDFDGSRVLTFEGLGQPTMAYVDAVMGGGAVTNATLRLRDSATLTQAWTSGVVADPSTGLRLVITRGDVGEGYIERLIEVTIEPL